MMTIYLHCPDCDGGRVFFACRGEDDRYFDCSTCGGTDEARCCEQRCSEAATREWRERNQTHTLCDAHYREWCKDAEIEPMEAD